MRASDADRERVAAELNAHWVSGRLALDELDERLAAVMSARTAGTLTELMHDLPTVPGAVTRPQPEPDTRSWLPGRRPFTRRLFVPASLARAREIAADGISPALCTYGYELTAASAAGLVFERHRRFGWAAAAAVVLFPFGLLALLLASGCDQIAVLLDELGPDDTRITVRGVAPHRLREAFARLGCDQKQAGDPAPRMELCIVDRAAICALAPASPIRGRVASVCLGLVACVCVCDAGRLVIAAIIERGSIGPLASAAVLGTIALWPSRRLIRLRASPRPWRQQDE
jgi:hypothetical protein